MNIQGDDKLLTLRELADKKNLDLSYLKRQVLLGRMESVDKKGETYTLERWYYQWSVDFSFLGYMKKEVLGEQLNDVEMESQARILSQEVETETQKGKLDIEHEFVKKWNTHFKKINEDFNKHFSKKSSTDKRLNKLETKTRNHDFHGAALISLVMILISIYSVLLFPGISKAFTSKIDTLVSIPHSAINGVAAKVFLDDNQQFVEDYPVDNNDLSEYVRRTSESITYPTGSSLDVSKKEIVGRVAGIQEANQKELGLMDRIKEITKDILVKISEKQKRASMELNEKLSNFLSID